MNSGRRDFFKAVGSAAAAAAAVSPALISTAEAAIPKDKGTKFSPGFQHSLVLDGAPAGLLRSFDGGDIVGVVVKDPATEAGIVPKRIAGHYIEDILLACDAGLSPVLLQWIQQMLNRNPQVKSGAIVSADERGRPQMQMNFTDALLTEVEFPALDAASKEVATINLRLSPEMTQHSEPPEPTKPTAPSKGPDSGKSKTKHWLTSNFRFFISGLDTATRRVTSIEAISIKQNVLQSVPALTARTGDRNVEPLDVGSIVFTIPEQFAQPFYEWHHNFVVAGIEEGERYARIEYMDPAFKAPLATLEFFGVGVVRVSRLAEDSQKAGQRLVEVELYAETVSFNLGGPVPA